MTKQKATPTSEATESKTIHQRMHSAMKALDFIAKDKTNDFHKYNYASEQAIKEAVHAQLVEHGILFHMNFVDLIRNDGNNLLFVVFEYSFINVDNPEDFIKGQFIGSGEDKGDKAIYKAITGAIKYALTSSFLIPTGDDPENEPQSKPQTQGFQRPQAKAQPAQVRPAEQQPQQPQAQPAQPQAKPETLKAKEGVDTRPKLDNKACEQYAQRILKGDAELFSKILEYYKVTDAQKDMLAQAHGRFMNSQNK